MHCVFLHLSIIPSMNFLIMCATVTLVWDQTRQVSLHFAHASLNHPWPCRCLTSCPSLDQFWLLLTTVYWQDPTIPAILEVLWPSRLAITCQSLRSLFLPNLPVPNTLAPNTQAYTLTFWNSWCSWQVLYTHSTQWWLTCVSVITLNPDLTFQKCCLCAFRHVGAEKTADLPQ